MGDVELAYPAPLMRKQAGISDPHTAISEKASFLKLFTLRCQTAGVLSAWVVSSPQTFHSQCLLTLLSHCDFIHPIQGCSICRGKNRHELLPPTVNAFLFLTLRLWMQELWRRVQLLKAFICSVYVQRN